MPTTPAAAPRKTACVAKARRRPALPSANRAARYPLTPIANKKPIKLFSAQHTPQHNPATTSHPRRSRRAKWTTESIPAAWKKSACACGEIMTP